MLEIIIFFVVIGIGLGILKAIWDALSEVLLGLLGLGIIIAAVVFLGPLALGLLGAAIPVILALLPFGLALLAALWVLGCVLRFFQGLKYRGRLRRDVGKAGGAGTSGAYPGRICGFHGVLQKGGPPAGPDVRLDGA